MNQAELSILFYFDYKPSLIIEYILFELIMIFNLWTNKNKNHQPWIINIYIYKNYYYDMNYSYNKL